MFRTIIKRISESLKMQILICIILCAIIIMGFLTYKNVLDKKNFKEYTISKNNNIVNSIEKIESDNNNIIIDGYAFLLGKDSNDIDISLFLLGSNSKTEVWPDVEKIIRSDVDTYYKSNNNYEYSGFRATLKESNLKSDESYEIMINLNYNEKGSDFRQTVSSNHYIQNGLLYDYNPREFNIPNLDIQSELLKEVFSRGQLCFFDKEIGMYIYQYQRKIYWIANNEFDFDLKGKTYIPFYIYTTQVDKLPAERIPYEVDVLDFYFEDAELMDENILPYRVAARTLPEEYAIAYILTAQIDIGSNKWLWSTTFHLDDIIKTNNK